MRDHSDRNPPKRPGLFGCLFNRGGGNRSIHSDLNQRCLRLEFLEDRTMLDGTFHPMHVFIDPATGDPWVPPADRDVVPADIAPLGSSSPVGKTPVQINNAYGVNSVSLPPSQLPGEGTTIAIVDAYDDPNIEDDLEAFDDHFQIAAPSSFVKVDQNGGTNYPNTDYNWITEIALDVEWVHAIAPGASILLVEADAPSLGDLMAAVDYARNATAVVAVSMSWGAGEFFTQTRYDDYFTTPASHTGVTFLASTGDSGSPGSYPAYSPNVVAVGGTSLTLSGNDYASESGWSGSGGGQSAYEGEATYQGVIQTSLCRQIPDIAFDADPYSGVAVYDSYNGGTNPWYQIGGTSLSSPCWAGLIAIADQVRVSASVGDPLDGRWQTLPALYALSSSDFHDIQSGSNGDHCAGTGYDMVTGLGTPVAGALVAGLAATTISATPLPDVTSLMPSVRVVRDNNVGTGAFSLTLTYNTPMDDSVNPTITFPAQGKDPTAGSSPTLTFDAGTWSEGDTTYVATFDVADADATMCDIVIHISGAQDTYATTQSPDNFVAAFGIDTFNPAPIPRQVDLVSSAGSSPSNSHSVSNSFAVSGDGRLVVFQSDATNLVEGDTNGYCDIFVKDMTTGVVTLVSTDRTGSQANGDSYEPAISADGTCVAFVSDATNLIPPDQDTNNASDVFVKNLSTGETTRVSVRNDGAQEGFNGYGSNAPSISADGRYVAFTCLDYYFGGTQSGAGVFVRDRTANTTTAVSCASVTSTYYPPSQPAISGDGQYVAYVKYVNTDVAGQMRYVKQAYRWHMGDGASPGILLSPSIWGNGGGDDDSDAPSISNDGRYVAFQSFASDLVYYDSNYTRDIFVTDLTNPQAPVVRRVDTNSAGDETEATEWWGNSLAPAISGDGRYVAFASSARNLVPDDANAAYDVFVKDWQTWIPGRGTTIRLSTAENCDEGDFDSGELMSGLFGATAISANGRYVAFTSIADNLVPGDTDDAFDVFRVSNRLVPPSVGAAWPKMTLISDAAVGTATFYFRLHYDGAMDENVDPTVTFSVGLGTSLTFNAGESGWSGDRDYTAIYNVADVNAQAYTITVSATGAYDTDGHEQYPYTAPSGFSIDTLGDVPATPTVVDQYPTNATEVTDIAVATGTFSITILYDQPMNPAVKPSVTLTADGPYSEAVAETLTYNPDASGWAGDYAFVAVFDVADMDETVPAESITVNVSGAYDRATFRPQDSYSDTAAFSIDTADTSPAQAQVSIYWNIDNITDQYVGQAAAEDLYTGFWVRVAYDKAMNLGTAPVVTFTSSNQTAVMGTLQYRSDLSFWGSDRVYYARYDVVDVNALVSSVGVSVDGARDLATFQLQDHFHQADVFAIDTYNPEVTSLYANIATVTAAAEGTDTFFIAVHYDRPVLYASTPTITFSADVSEALAADWGTWSGQTYIAFYSVLTPAESVSIPDISVIVTDAQSADGNLQDGIRVDHVFSIDIQV